MVLLSQKSSTQNGSFRVAVLVLAWLEACLSDALNLLAFRAFGCDVSCFPPKLEDFKDLDRDSESSRTLPSDGGRAHGDTRGSGFYSALRPVPVIAPADTGHTADRRERTLLHEQQLLLG